MRRLHFNLISFVAVAALAAAAMLTCRAQEPSYAETWVEPPADFGYEEFPVPRVAVTGDLLWLHRTDMDPGQILITGTNSNANVTVPLIRSDDINLPTEAGVRFSVVLGPPTGRYVEFTYGGIFNQDATLTVFPNGATQTDPSFFGWTYSLINNPNSPQILQHTVSYESTLHTLEMNLWSDAELWRLRPFIGARWIRQTETFQNFETQLPDYGGRADLSNNLFGGQVGVATVLWQRADWFHVQATAKGGVYWNDMDLDAAFNFAGVPIATLSREKSTTSCNGQLDITAVWHLTPYLDFHAGYTGLWLTQMGLAGNQNDNFDLVAGTGDFDVSRISYQGGHVGVTLAW